MNLQRISGIFITITLLIWALIFFLSPQPKYQKINAVSIPSPLKINDLFENLQEIEPYQLEKSNMPISIEDNIPSAKNIVEKVDFSLYVYKIGAFKSLETVTKVIQSYNDAGFPAFTQINQSNQELTTILVGPFVSKDDINGNQEKLNKIAGIINGEIVAWNP